MKHKGFLLVIACMGMMFGIFLSAQETVDQTAITFEKITLSDVHISEGVSVGDFDKDGNLDVASGPYLWKGPDFTDRTRIGANGDTSYDVNSYSYYYMPVRPADVNGDGWLDVPFQTGLQIFNWLENPGEGNQDGEWKEHNLGPGMGGESSQFFPSPFGDEGNVLIAGYNYDDQYEGPLSWSRFDKTAGKWVWHIISEKKYAFNSHGIGVGDINGDGRKDILAMDGWYEQPVSVEGDPLWTYHEFLWSFNPYNSRQNLGGSHFFVDDLDGDGDGDVVGALESHGWGLAWYEHIVENGEITFIPHMIMGTNEEAHIYGVGFSQLHTLGYVDIDGDGLKDIVAGKRWKAHNGKDPDSDGLALLYWFKQTRGEEGTTFVPHKIDSSAGSGCSIEVQKDLDGDGHPDIVTSSKKGTYIFLTRGHEKTIAAH